MFSESEVSFLDGGVVEQEEKFELVRTEVYALLDAFLQTPSNTHLLLVSSEDTGISYHFYLPTLITQILHKFKLTSEAFLNLFSEYPQIIGKLDEIDIFLVAFSFLDLLEDALVDVVELTVLENGGFGFFPFYETVVEHQSFVGKTATQLKGCANGEFKTTERVRLMKSLAVSLEETRGHLTPS